MCSECATRPARSRGLCHNCYERARRQANPDHHRALQRARNARHRALHGAERNRKERERRAADPERSAAVARGYYYRHRAKRLELQHQMRARSYGVAWEPVDWREVHARDNGTCVPCGLPVPFEDMSLDHVVPLSQGGPHGLGNVQTSHLICNRRRR